VSALFYVPAAVAVASGILVIAARNAMHGLLSLLALLLAIAAMLFSIGAPLAAALQIIVYAGAIMVLFVFAVMILNPGRAEEERERVSLSAWAWIPPAALAGAMLAITVAALVGMESAPAGAAVGPEQVGIALFRPYVVGVEVASVLLLAGLVAALHFRLQAGAREEAHAGRRAR
jgi:NADH-quinone oxidoreductase subunit J